jgi:hypothetical protein
MNQRSTEEPNRAGPWGDLSPLTNPRKCPRAWLILGLFLLFCAGLTMMPVYSERSRRTPFWEKCQKVQRGMTEQEVEAILGAPVEDEVGGVASYRSCVWREGNQTLWLLFGEYGAFGKRFIPRPAWERFIPGNGRDDRWDP